MVDYVGYIKEMIDKYEKEYEELKKAVEVMKKAGEDVTALEVKLESVKATIDRWKEALSS